MNKRIVAYKRYLENNCITYEELLKSGYECVYVSGILFNILTLFNQQSKLDDKNFWEILGKYFHVDDMSTYLYGARGIARYWVVDIRDLKYLMDHTKKTPNLSAMFIKCDIKVSELEDEINDLKIKYEKKKEENYNKRNGTQLTKRK